MNIQKKRSTVWSWLEFKIKYQICDGNTEKWNILLTYVYIYLTDAVVQCDGFKYKQFYFFFVFPEGPKVVLYPNKRQRL